MKTRFDVIKFITYHIVNGKGIKIYLDGDILRMESPKDKPYCIWHNETHPDVAAIIHDEQDSDLDFISEWASHPVEHQTFYYS